MATINVTQTDIDNSNPLSHDENCIALALKRIKQREDIRVFAYLGYARIGKRRYELDQWGSNRLIIHGTGHKIAPFIFELADTWTTKTGI